MSKFDYLGFGLGLRALHYQDIIEKNPPVEWFEIVTEDYLIPHNKPNYYLTKIAAHYPIVMHGVSLSIGSSDPLDWNYLKQVKTLADRIKPCWISDHLCWTGVNGVNLHDLLPLPYTEEALQHVVKRIAQVQDYLGQPILLENPSTYVTFNQSQLTEWDFMREVAKQADCFILLDINNIYVSAYNHHFDPYEYLNKIPVERVKQFHLAGHQNHKTHLIDTHDHEIISDVWKLYRAAVKRFGQVSTMIERDDHIPPLDDLLEELNEAKVMAEEVINSGK